MVVLQAVMIGMLVMAAGTLPRNVLFAANLRFYSNIPWSVPVIAVYLLFFWQYLAGKGPPDTNSLERRLLLRARQISGREWGWALLAGGLGIVSLVLGLDIANRLIVLPSQQLPDLSHVPRFTLLCLLLASAPIAGVVEESAFRGYMQGPLERRCGLPIAIVITGTMFAVAHLDFTLILWPYYVAVAAIYGTVTYFTQSILPAVMLHTAGNLYSNFDLWLHGKAEWQTAKTGGSLIWKTGMDVSFIVQCSMFAIFGAAMLWAFLRLARISSARIADD